MSSVVLQILFFFVAGACVFGVLFVFSREEKETDPIGSGEVSNHKPHKPAQQPALAASATVASSIIWKRASHIFRSAAKQPHEIFVHTRRIIAQVRGEKEPSVLDKTFEQDPEKFFSLQEVAGNPEEGQGMAQAAGKDKQAPKLVQQLHEQFEKRKEQETGEKPDNEEEFWLGILRQNPHVAHPYKKLGEIYLKRGEYKEARASLSFALAKDPEDNEAAALLAEVKEKRNTKRIKNDELMNNESRMPE